MLYNSLRLPLVINIGLLAAQANAHSKLNMKFPFTNVDDPDRTPNYFLENDLWSSVEDSLIELAEMDHKNNFYPNVSPLLTEFGLLQEYWRLRDYLTPNFVDPDDIDFDD